MSASDPFVWHFVLARDGQPIARGERLGTLVLPPELVAQLPPGRLARTLELQRQQWARAAIAGGFIDGWAVHVHAERGFRRSLFPAAALPGLTAAPALVTPGGSRP